MHGRAFYDAVGDALTGFLPPSLRDFVVHRSSYNLKLWYHATPGGEREHYEVQLIKWNKMVGLEIGFHAEHADAGANDATLGRLVAAEAAWRKTLGSEPVAGAFLASRFKTWRRISEFWDGADGGDDPDLAIDAAERLAKYIKALEPLRA
jgi:hypothetical protein